MKEYEINSSTMAIVPLDDSNSMVYEEEENYVVKQSANSIIKKNCEFYGSSYQGRCVGTKALTGIKTKFPIIIEESRNIIFFPTTSARTQQATWIALNKIDKYKLNIILCIALIFILALFQGHILVTPSNSIYVALILSLEKNKKIKD